MLDDAYSGVLGGHVAWWMHGRMCLMGGVFGDSVHHVAYQTRCNCVEIGVKGAGGCMWWSGCVGP